MSPLQKNRSNVAPKDDEPKKEGPRETLNFYLHHLEQVDRLLKVIELLKKENKQMRKMLNINNKQMPIPEEMSEEGFKPKITCWTFKEED